MKFLSIKILIIFIFFSVAVININSQSRYLENGIGGSAFQINTVFADTELLSAGLSAAYSIGGIMDIGFQLNRELGTVYGYESTCWSFDFLYNIIVLKQTDYIPLSLQLESTYGFTNVSSDYLTATDKTREGQGLQLGASFFREFFPKKLFSFLIGAKGIYKNYKFTEVDSALSTTLTERSEEFSFGGIVAVSFKPKKWPIFSIEVEVLFNQTSGISVEPSFLITSPKY
jgi:hypothetical protein